MKEVKNGKIIIKISIMWFFIAIIIIALIISFFKNRIFATNTANKEEQTIVAFEENQKSIDVIEVMLENTNSDKKMVNEQRDVQFETQYEDNPNLPRDEEQVKQEGKIGKIQVTALQEYKDDQMINEEIIDSKTLEEVVTKIIYKGTSDFLKKYSVHIDDQMYLLEAEDLKEEAKDDSNTICNVPRYLNVKIKEAGEECKEAHRQYICHNGGGDTGCCGDNICGSSGGIPEVYTAAFCDMYYRVCGDNYYRWSVQKRNI